MSDSWISWNPRTEEPSNGWPSANFSSVSSWIGNDRCCTCPGRSVKRRSTINAPASLAIAMTSLGVFGLATMSPFPWSDGDLARVGPARHDVPLLER